MMPENNWIPLDPKLPGFRLPTEADATKDHRQEVWATNRDGNVVNVFWGYLVGHRNLFAAWMPIDRPEPYKPPEVKQERQRVKLYKSRIDRKWYEVDADWIDGNYVYRGVDDGVQVAVEVIPGDPTPEDIAEVIAELQELNVPVDRVSVLADCITKLGGTP